MQVMMFMSVFWTLYGIAGLFGIQNIPSKYKGYTWTKEYIRCQGISWLMLGIPWLIFYLVHTFYLADKNIGAGVIVLILVLFAVPSIIYTIKWDKKFRDLLSRETNCND